jgi:glyoxalase family protein
MTGARDAWGCAFIGLDPRSSAFIRGRTYTPVMPLLGIHHVSAICADAQRNADFYVNTLGLRLAKVTVNFDDPTSYHLYYADGTGSPGSLMTFFVWPGGRRGRVGPPQVTAIAYAIETGSLDFWQRRLADAGATCSDVGMRFGEPFIRVEDPDGLAVELIGVDAGEVARDVGRGTGVGPSLSHVPAPLSLSLPPGYAGSTVEPQHTLRTMHSVTLHESALDRTAATLTGTMGLVERDTEGDVRRFAMAGGGVGRFVDVHFDATKAGGRSGAGIVHHVAFRVADDASQVEWQTRLHDAKLGVTAVAERTYFRSIYFREPGGVLFEIATDGPGVGIDEPEGMGRALRIPPWFEEHRATILAGLPKFTAAGITFPSMA